MCSPRLGFADSPYQCFTFRSRTLLVFYDFMVFFLEQMVFKGFLKNKALGNKVKHVYEPRRTQQGICAQSTYHFPNIYFA